VATKKLPVIATAKEAIKLPLIHWREFFRFGCIPLGIVLLRLLILVPSTAEGMPLQPHLSLMRVILGVLLSLASAIAWFPLQIAWIRLALNGPNSVADRPIWTFGRTERRFLIGTLLLASITLGPFALVLLLTLATQLIALRIFLVIAAIGLLVAGLICAVRLWFILIEIALQRYQSLRDSWDKTRGIVWRLIGVNVSAVLPFLIVAGICGYIQENVTTYVAWVELALVGTVFTILPSTSAIGALALAYKFTTPTTPPSETAAVATS